MNNCEIVKENTQLNDKLKKIDKYCESTKEKHKYYNECNTTDVRVISKIKKGRSGYVLITLPKKEEEI